MNRVLLGFWYFAPDGSVAPETDFGTYEKTSDDPLTIEYTFADDAVWSDGEPIDCDDAWLAWYSQSGQTDTFKPVSTDGYEDIDTVECADGDKTFIGHLRQAVRRLGRQLRRHPPGTRRREGSRHRRLHRRRRGRRHQGPRGRW